MIENDISRAVLFFFLLFSFFFSFCFVLFCLLIKVLSAGFREAHSSVSSVAFVSRRNYSLQRDTLLSSREDFCGTAIFYSFISFFFSFVFLLGKGIKFKKKFIFLFFTRSDVSTKEIGHFVEKCRKSFVELRLLD